MPSEDVSYFRARAVEEREQASAAAIPAVRAVHLDFADRYDRMATGPHSGNELRLSPRSSSPVVEFATRNEPFRE